ncbi:MAG: DNA-3-methyladenine glycosylase [Candidatus Paceibacterota bacterium]
MRKRKLSRNFFDRPTLTVARELVGKFLVRKIGEKTIFGMITETEAYCGADDKACHAYKGRTKRTEIMFGPSGHAYVYLIYGMYNCLNVVTEKKDYPAAVLIRGVKMEDNLNGPGKVCRGFKIDRGLNGEDITKSQNLWLEDRGSEFKPTQIKKSKRIGVDYAEEYTSKLWRFWTEF